MKRVITCLNSNNIYSFFIRELYYAETLNHHCQVAFSQCKKQFILYAVLGLLELLCIKELLQ